MSQVSLFIGILEGSARPVVRDALPRGQVQLCSTKQHLTVSDIVNRHMVVVRARDVGIVKDKWGYVVFAT